MPGGVDNMNFHIFPVAGRYGRGNGNAAFLLIWHPVHDGFTIVDFTDSVGTAGVIKNPLGDRRLSGINMGNDADIAHVSYFDTRTHRINSMFAFSGTCRSIWPASVADSFPLTKILTASTSGTFNTKEFAME